MLVDAPLALYRRYRPDTFADMIGQDHVTTPLSAALANNRVNHAYLFSGPRGCGKTTSARIMARALNCEQGPTADALRRVRLLRRAGHRRARLARRDRDRRGQPRRRRRRPRPARTRVLLARAGPLQGLHHRRGPHGQQGGLQRPPQARRGAAVPPALHLRDHRAGQGHRHHPVAHPPLPVPAGRAQGAWATTCSPSARARASTIEPTVVPLIVRAGAGSVRDSL